MCTGDGPDGGGDGEGTGVAGPGHGGEAGTQGGGSGGNVGEGFGGGSGGTPTGRGDPVAFGDPGAAAPAPSSGSGDLFGGWEEATSIENQSVSSLTGGWNTTGALGFSPAQGVMVGSILGPLGMTIGGALGLATGEGSVDDYGGGDPDAGGGPGEPGIASLRPGGPKPPGWGDSFIGDLMAGNVTPINTTERSTPGTKRGFGLGLTPDKPSRIKEYGTSNDDDLLNTLVFNEDEFTKNLF